MNFPIHVTLQVPHSTVFRFYTKDIQESHARLMKEIPEEILKILICENSKLHVSDRISEKLNGKIRTPSSGTFTIEVMEDECTPAEDILVLLYRWDDLYFAGFYTQG